MGFGSAFSSPVNSPTIIKGKLFSRLTSGGNLLPSSPGPPSCNSSAASSPTSLYSPTSCSLTSLPGLHLAQGQPGGASKRKIPMVLKLAAASQKLSLTKSISPEQQKESFSSLNSISHQHQVAEGTNSNGQSRDQSSCPATSSAGRNSRSPTSLLPSSAAMDTIFEEDGMQGGSIRKSSIGNHFDSSDTMSHLSQRSSTFAPRSSGCSENGNNALTEEGDYGKRIVDNDTNFAESVANFNHLHSSIAEEGASTSPLQSPVRAPQRSRRGATLSIDTAEDLATVANKIQSMSLFRGNRKSLRQQNSSSGSRASSPLSYSRSKTLPVSQSIHDLKSRETAGEMTRSGIHRSLSRTASEPGLDCIAEGDASGKEIQWPKDRESVAKLTKSTETLSGGGGEGKGSGPRKTPKAKNKFPAHIQKLLTDHLQKKMATVRAQSPLVMHQMKSPTKSPRTSMRKSAAASIDPPSRDAKGATSQRKTYLRSISEPETEDKASIQMRDKVSISPRKTAIISERENLSVSRLVVAAYRENIYAYCLCLTT